MNIEKLQRKAIARMKPYDSSIVAQAMCKMDQNESPYDIPKRLKEKIMRGVGRAQFNRYPDLSYLKLRRIMARQLGLSEENVAVGLGVDDMLYCVSLAFLEKNDKAVYFTPTFGMYRICCEITGAKLVEIPLKPDFSLPEQFLKECRNAKLVFLCRPNNPTGNSVPLAEVERIVCASKGLVCIDEAYADFADDNCISLLKYPNVVIFRTLSKAFSAAGVRVGFAIADREVISVINKVRLPWNLSVFSQMAAEELLLNRNFVRQRIRAIKSERLRLLSSLRLMGAKPAESESNFILFEIGNSEEVFKRLLSEGMLVRRFSSPALRGFLRVSVGTRKENDCFLRSLLRSSVDAVFFDIDDTLVNVSKSYIEAIRLTAQRIFGKRVPMGLVRRVKAMAGMNNDWDATVEVLRRIGVKSSRRQVVPIFQGIYLGKDGDGLIQKETALLNLKLLGKIGRRVAVVTGRPKGEAKIALRLLGLPANTLLVAMGDAEREKPDPAPLLLAEKLSGAEFPIYIGDSASDRVAAQRAGIGFVAIGKGKRLKGEFARFASVNDALKGLFL